MNTTERAQILALVLALAAGPAGAREKAKPADKTKGAPAEAALATVGDTPITASQFEKALGNRLFALRNQEYEMKKQLLEELIGDALLSKAAQSRGIAVDELLRQEVDAKVAPVAEEETRKVYENVKGRYPNKSETDLMSEIAANQRGQRFQARRAELVKELRAHSPVRILLDPPRVAVDAGSLPAKGAKGAPVTIIEFSDFQCPYCSRVTPTLKQLEDRFGDTLRVVFRDYPLPIHPQAPKAAEAAGCASEQGKFWEMHDRLFANQAKLQVADLKQHALDLGLNAEQFDQCLDSGKREASWRKDLEEGTRYGVSGTPAFFINGRLVSGAQPYDNFVRIIEDELQRAGLPVPPPPPPPAPAATDAKPPEAPKP